LARSPVTGKKQRTLHLDLLPQDVQDKILALAAKARTNGVIVTTKQVEYALDVLANGIRTGTKGWEKTNSAIAIGRVALVFFNENPEIKTKFRNHITKMQSSGRVVDRGNRPSGESATG
jgi:hypothetical protein